MYVYTCINVHGIHMYNSYTVSATQVYTKLCSGCVHLLVYRVPIAMYWEWEGGRKGVPIYWGWEGGREGVPIYWE